MKDRHTMSVFFCILASGILKTLNMKRIVFVLTAFALLAIQSCKPEEKTDILDRWEWPTPTPAPQPTITPQPTPDPEDDGKWKDITASFEGLSEGINIYKAPDKLLDVKAVAYIATLDTKKDGFKVWGINAPDLNGCSEPFKTPMEVYEAYDHPSVVINAGFFYASGNKYYSSSLEVSEGKLLSPNINYASLDWITMYYPTRGAFLEHEDGSYEVCWTFWKGAGAHWTYSKPSPNSWDAAPQQQPNASFPEVGNEFEAVNGIGGGPVLIKNGTIRNTAAEELFNGSNGIMVGERHPRTAIGITRDLKLVLFVCEGRQMTDGVAGFTTAEVAQILKDFGCTDAMNLDGGGSSLMLVCGQEMIKPSDKKERAVGSCVYFK